MIWRFGFQVLTLLEKYLVAVIVEIFKELGKLMGEFGSPLAGCLPLIVQMPILFALFATLRGSPFADVPYLVNIKVLPSDQIAAVEPKPFKTAKHSIVMHKLNDLALETKIQKEDGTNLY